MSKRSLVPAIVCSSFLIAVGCSPSATVDSPGTGGTATTGTGGSTTTGTGGSTTTGTGGSTTTGTGGSTTTGTGGAVTTGTGGAATGTGGAATGTGGRGGSTGTGGATTSTGGRGGTTAATGGATGTGGAVATGNEFWISPTGKDTNPGTKDAPIFTLCDDTLKTGACYKFCPMGGTCIPGGTIWVMDGTYKYTTIQKIGSTKNATAAAPYNVFAVAGAKPVFDFTGQPVDAANRGIQHQGNFWHFKGITVTKAGDTGIFIMGNDNTFEQCVVHHNQDMGLAIGVNKNVAGSGQNNTILNCDSYQNRDDANGGENADGFGLKENSGAGNKFVGCRAWDNADDGWDFYGWTSPVSLENCWAVSNSKTTSGGNSDGNGFKLGGLGVSAAHTLKNCFATDNKYGSSGKGIIKNSNPGAITCTGCAAWDNKAASDVPGVATTAPAGATAAKMIAAPRDASGNLPAITAL